MIGKGYRMAGWAVVAAAAMALTACRSPQPGAFVPLGTLVVTNETQSGLSSAQGSNSCCPSYCGFINFNNSGAGFTLSANQTFTMQLSLSSSMSPLIDTANYCARWRYGGGTNQTGCFSVSSSTQERFTAPVAAKYAITVYIKNNCPPNGTLYYMTYQ